MADEIASIRKYWLDFDSFKKRYLKKNVKEFPNRVLEEIPTPLVSVMILTYQHVNYIREAIESVLMQKTDFPFEIIIGDDESSDGTSEICREYAKKHPKKIRFLQHSKDNNININGKPSHLFQFVYNAFTFRGKYVTIISGDDYWTDENKIQAQAEFLNNNIKFSYCYHSWKYKFEVDPDKEIINPYELKKNPRTQTWMIKNIYDRLPNNFLKVIQEDTFTKIILENIYGEGKYLSNINPTVYRIISSSLFSSISYKNKLVQRVNRDLRIAESFGNSTAIAIKLKYRYLAHSLANYFIHFGNVIYIENGKNKIFKIAKENRLILFLLKLVLAKTVISYKKKIKYLN